MDFRDVLMWGVTLFALGLGLIVINNVTSIAHDTFLANPTFNSTNETVQVLGAMEKVNNSMDYFFFMMFLGMVLGIIVTAWAIGGNPIILIIYIILAIGGMITNLVFANIWETISTGYFASSLTSFTLMNHILLYAPYYFMFAFIVGIVIMLAKPTQQEGDR